MKNWGVRNSGQLDALFCSSLQNTGSDVAFVKAWVWWTQGHREEDVEGLEAVLLQKMERTHCLLLLHSLTHVCWIGVLYSAVQPPFLFLLYWGTGPSAFQPGSFRDTLLHSTTWVAEVNEYISFQRCLKMDTWPNWKRWDVCVRKRIFHLLWIGRCEAVMSHLL